MTDSVAPRRKSARASLHAAATASRFIAEVLVTGVCVRFTIAGAEHALGVSGANFSEKPAPHVAADTPPVPAESAALRPHGAEAQGAPRPSPGPLPAGRSLRVTLGVNVGSPRSEVYVNGSHVGDTPFLGDTSCKSGQTIRIEVVPATGPPLTYLRECRGGELAINGPPP